MSICPSLDLIFETVKNTACHWSHHVECGWNISVEIQNKTFVKKEYNQDQFINYMSVHYFGMPFRGAWHFAIHDEVIKWKHFPSYWPFVRGIHRSPVNSPHKGQWRGTLMFSLICAWINGWVNSGDTGDWRRHRAHYDVTVMMLSFYSVDDGMAIVPCLTGSYFQLRYGLARGYLSVL